MGLGLVYGGIRIKGRPVATEHDFYSTHESLRLRFEDFEQIRLYDDPAQATVSEMVERSPRRRDAGLLALTWVHSGTGVKIPAQEIAEAVRPALVVLDGVHGLAADDLPIDSVDVLVAGTHKWLGGPRGTGLVWSRSWDRLRALHPDLPPRLSGRELEPRRLPHLRAPLGARRGVRLPPPDRAHQGHQADPEPRDAAQAGSRRAAQRAARDADGRGGVGRDRVLRGRRARPSDGGHAAPGAQDRGLGHALRAAVRAAAARACGSTRPTSTPRWPQSRGSERQFHAATSLQVA